jgi:hypothetical protein
VTLQTTQHTAVIAGLDPAISRRLATDARVKPGHDDFFIAPGDDGSFRAAA